MRASCEQRLCPEETEYWMAWVPVTYPGLCVGVDLKEITQDRANLLWRQLKEREPQDKPSCLAQSFGGGAKVGSTIERGGACFLWQM